MKTGFLTRMADICPRLTTPIAALLLCALCLPMLTGCTPAQQQTTLQVVTEINTHIPEVVAAANTASSVVSELIPAEAPIVGLTDAAFDKAAAALQALTAQYIANPTASLFTQIQAAISTLEGQVQTAISNASTSIKDAKILNAVKAALQGLLTVATVVFGLIAPTLSAAQVHELRERDTIHLARMRPYMDERVLRQEADAHGVDLDRSFRLATAAGL